ncbi:hypothetical protein ABPG73_018933 [Tetrahymena malaccensis]
MDINYSNQKSQSQFAIQDEMIYEKDLVKLGTKVNTVLKNQYLNKQETMVQQKHKQNFQKASNIISRLLNSSMNRIMRIRQNVKVFIYNLKIRHSNRKMDNLSEKEYQIINDLSHFHRQKDQIHKSFKIFLLLSRVLKKSQQLAIFMPTDTSRVIWDLIQVVFTYTFFYFYSILIFFDQNDFDTNFIQQISFYAFVFFLLDILVNLNTAFFDKDIIITRRKLIAKQYILSSIFITDLISMFILGSKVIYSNSFISNNTNQNLFLFGLNLLIFLKGNGISYKKKRFDYIFTLSENQKHIFKLINQLASVITVAHIAAIGWYFVGVSESNNQQNNWLDKLNISSYTYYQKYIYSIYWSITTMTTAQEQKDRDKQQEDKILSVLSNKLRDEITHEINSKILNNYLIFSSNFTQSTLNKLIFVMKEILVNPNEVIITEGQSDDSSIYFIQNGIIEIYQQQIQKQNMISVIKTLTKGQIFGEISFFSGLQRQSSARSVNLSTLYKINREEFIEILKENTEDFERFKMMQDQIIFQKDITITHSECYNCKNSGHLANQCPRTHQYFDKQFIILKQNFSIFQERLFKERANIKSKYNAKLLQKKNQGIIQRLKQNIQKEDDEIYQMFTNQENLNTDYSQSQLDNEDFQDEDDEEEDSKSQITLQFEDKENDINIKKIQQQLDKAEKQIKSINHFNSNITNCDDNDQIMSLENQIQNFNSNFVYENQDFARAKSNTFNSQGMAKSFEVSESNDSINQDCMSNNLQKQTYYPESIKAIYKKDTKLDLQSSMLNYEEDEGQNSNKSKKFDKQKQFQTINSQFTDYLKSQMKQGPCYSNLNKHIQKQVSNQSVDDNSQYQNSDIPNQQINKGENNNQRKSKSTHLHKSKKNSYSKNLVQNQSQKEVRSSVEQMLLQNIVQMGLIDKRSSDFQNKSNDNFNQDKNQKIQSSIRSIRDNIQQKSNQYLQTKNNNQRPSTNSDQNKQQQEKNGGQIQSENQQILDRIAKLLQTSQLPLLFQLNNGKSLLQDSQFLQNQIDQFDKIQQFKKFYPENNFDKVLHKLKITQQEQKKQKKMKLASKERRQNIGFGNTIRVSIFQGNANIIRFKPQDYDINLYKPTYLSYGIKMQKGVNFPLNMISKKLQALTIEVSNSNKGDKFGFDFGFVLLNLNQILRLNLDLSFNQIHSQGIIELSKSLQKCQMIHSLSLKLNNNPINDEGAIKLCSSINSSGNLYYLLLILRNTKITSKTTLSLFSQNSNWDNLATLRLCLSFNDLGDKGISGLCTSLKNLKKISSLELFLRRTGINSKGISSFSQYLSQCVSIQNLTLNLVQNNICSNGKSSLGAALSNCINLSTLNLYFQENNIDLSDYAKVINRFISYFKFQSQLGDSLVNPLAKCTNLQKLAIELGSNKINNQTVQKIGVSLKSLKILSSLKLELSNNNISSEGFSGLCQGLEYCKNLIVLHLLIGKNKINDDAFVHFKLTQFQKLTDLTLEFYENQISHSGATIISFEIANCQNLQSILLDLNSNLIEDQSITFLGFNLARCSNLKQIKLWLNDNPISLQALLALIQPFKQIKDLQLLHIFLRNNYSENSFLKELALPFQKLINLLNITLIITNKTLKLIKCKVKIQC